MVWFYSHFSTWDFHTDTKSQLESFSSMAQPPRPKSQHPLVSWYSKASSGMEDTEGSFIIWIRCQESGYYHGDNTVDMMEDKLRGFFHWHVIFYVM